MALIIGVLCDYILKVIRGEQHLHWTLHYISIAVIVLLGLNIALALTAHIALPQKGHRAAGFDWTHAALVSSSLFFASAFRMAQRDVSAIEREMKYRSNPESSG